MKKTYMSLALLLSTAILCSGCAAQNAGTTDQSAGQTTQAAATDDTAGQTAPYTETTDDSAGQAAKEAETADDAAVFTALVEIPAGDNVKYETDEYGNIAVDRFMSMSVKYPANYASIKDTLGEDGDPLDALIFTREKLAPGVSIECRAIGYLKMIDGGEADEKIIAVPTGSVDSTYDEIQDIDDLPKIELARMEDFFNTYKLLPKGSKVVTTDSYSDVNSAKELLAMAKKAYSSSDAGWVNLNNYGQPENAPDEITVVIEIPQGTSIKYELDSLGYLAADRFMSTSVEYPANYGSIVSTANQDGDALDVLVYTRTPIYPGSIMTCRPIGCLNMLDGGDADSKIVAVPTDDVDSTYAKIKDIKDLPEMELARLENFFANYKNLPAGSKIVELSGYGNTGDAKKLIAQSMEAFSPVQDAFTARSEYPQTDAVGELTAVVEIPQGSIIKYEMDGDGNIAVDRFMAMPVAYPTNYGSLPQTVGGDGDPLDVLVYTREPLIPGSIVTVRPIGVMNMTDGGDADAKIVAVPISAVDPTYDDVKTIDDLPHMEQQRLEQFFSVYKNLSDKVVEINGFDNAATALKLVTQSLQR